MSHIRNPRRDRANNEWGRLTRACYWIWW